jgi:hypothetical protein
MADPTPDPTPDPTLRQALTFLKGKTRKRFLARLDGMGIDHRIRHQNMDVPVGALVAGHKKAMSMVPSPVLAYPPTGSLMAAAAKGMLEGAQPRDRPAIIPEKGTDPRFGPGGVPPEQPRLGSLEAGDTPQEIAAAEARRKAMFMRAANLGFSRPAGFPSYPRDVPGPEREHYPSEFQQRMFPHLKPKPRGSREAIREAAAPLSIMPGTKIKRHVAKPGVFGLKEYEFVQNKLNKLLHMGTWGEHGSAIGRADYWKKFTENLPKPLQRRFTLDAAKRQETVRLPFLRAGKKLLTFLRSAPPDEFVPGIPPDMAGRNNKEEEKHVSSMANFLMGQIYDGKWRTWPESWKKILRPLIVTARKSAIPDDKTQEWVDEGRPYSPGVAHPGEFRGLAAPLPFHTGLGDPRLVEAPEDVSLFKRVAEGFKRSLGSHVAGYLDPDNTSGIQKWKETYRAAGKRIAERSQDPIVLNFYKNSEELVVGAAHIIGEILDLMDDGEAAIFLAKYKDFLRSRGIVREITWAEKRAIHLNTGGERISKLMLGAGAGLKKVWDDPVGSFKSDPLHTALVVTGLGRAIAATPGVKAVAGSGRLIKLKQKLRGFETGLLRTAFMVPVVSKAGRVLWEHGGRRAKDFLVRPIMQRLLAATEDLANVPTYYKETFARWKRDTAKRLEKPPEDFTGPDIIKNLELIDDVRAREAYAGAYVEELAPSTHAKILKGELDMTYFDTLKRLIDEDAALSGDIIVAPKDIVGTATPATPPTTPPPLPLLPSPGHPYRGATEAALGVAPFKRVGAGALERIGRGPEEARAPVARRERDGRPLTPEQIDAIVAEATSFGEDIIVDPRKARYVKKGEIVPEYKADYPARERGGGDIVHARRPGAPPPFPEGATKEALGVPAKEPRVTTPKREPTPSKAREAEPTPAPAPEPVPPREPGDAYGSPVSVARPPAEPVVAPTAAPRPGVTPEPPAAPPAKPQARDPFDMFEGIETPPTKAVTPESVAAVERIVGSTKRVVLEAADSASLRGAAVSAQASILGKIRSAAERAVFKRSEIKGATPRRRGRKGTLGERARDHGDLVVGRERARAEAQAAAIAANKAGAWEAAGPLGRVEYILNPKPAGLRGTLSPIGKPLSIYSVLADLWRARRQRRQGEGPGPGPTPEEISSVTGAPVRDEAGVLRQPKKLPPEERASLAHDLFERAKISSKQVTTMERRALLKDEMKHANNVLRGVEADLPPVVATREIMNIVENPRYGAILSPKNKKAFQELVPATEASLDWMGVAKPKEGPRAELFVRPEVNRYTKWESKIKSNAKLDPLFTAMRVGSAIWKRTKTALNPMTFLTNTVSNYFLRAMVTGRTSIRPIVESMKMYRKWQRGEKVDPVAAELFDVFERKGWADFTSAELRAATGKGALGWLSSWAEGKHPQTSMGTAMSKADLAKSLLLAQPKWLKKGFRKMEDTYRVSDIWYKLEEGVARGQRVIKILDESSIGSNLVVPVGPGRTAVVFKTGPNSYALGGMKGKNLTQKQVYEVAADYGREGGNRLYFDYSKVPQFMQVMRRTGLDMFVSPFYTFFYKSLWVPGLKRGLGKEVLSGGLHGLRSSDPRIQQGLISAAAKEARTRMAMVAMAHGSERAYGFRDQALQTLGGYGGGREHPFLGVIGRGMGENVLRYVNLGGASPFQSGMLFARKVAPVERWFRGQEPHHGALSGTLKDLETPGTPERKDYDQAVEAVLRGQGMPDTWGRLDPRGEAAKEAVREMTDPDEFRRMMAEARASFPSQGSEFGDWAALFGWDPGGLPVTLIEALKGAKERHGDLPDYLRDQVMDIILGSPAVNVALSELTGKKAPFSRRGLKEYLGVRDKDLGFRSAITGQRRGLIGKRLNRLMQTWTKVLHEYTPDEIARVEEGGDMEGARRMQIDYVKNMIAVRAQMFGMVRRVIQELKKRNVLVRRKIGKQGQVGLGLEFSTMKRIAAEKRKKITRKARRIKREQEFFRAYPGFKP